MLESSALALAFVLACAQGQAEPIEETRQPVVVPGGVADATGRVLCLTEHGRGVVALNPLDGQVLWTSDLAVKPLALVEGRVAALWGKGNVLHVVVLDAARGTPVMESDPIVLPPWASVGTGLDHNGEGRRFETRVQLAGNVLLIHWSAGTSYYGGANPPPEVLQAATNRAAGIAKCALDTGTVEHLPESEQPFAPAGLTRVDQLPEKLREVASREHWHLGCVVGERAYGWVRESPDVAAGKGGTVIDTIQCLDPATGQIAWQRSFEERHLKPPPP